MVVDQLFVMGEGLVGEVVLFLQRREFKQRLVFVERVWRAQHLRVGVKALLRSPFARWAAPSRWYTKPSSTGWASARPVKFW